MWSAIGCLFDCLNGYNAIGTSVESRASYAKWFVS